MKLKESNYKTPIYIHGNKIRNKLLNITHLLNTQHSILCASPSTGEKKGKSNKINYFVEI